MSDNVNHPDHYGGGDNPYEAIKIIEHFGLGFCLGNALKYIVRCGKKGRESQAVMDLRKAAWYCNREADRLEKELQDAIESSTRQVRRNDGRSWRNDWLFRWGL